MNEVFKKTIKCVIKLKKLFSPVIRRNCITRCAINYWDVNSRKNYESEVCNQYEHFWFNMNQSETRQAAHQKVEVENEFSFDKLDNNCKDSKCDCVKETKNCGVEENFFVNLVVAYLKMNLKKFIKRLSSPIMSNYLIFEICNFRVFAVCLQNITNFRVISRLRKFV